jgi:hypothetical protein
MPALIANHQKKTAATQLKLFYSIFSQAIRLSEVDNGEAKTWVKPSAQIGAQNKEFFETYFLPYFKPAKYCGTDTGCNTPQDAGNTAVKIILTNSMSVAAYLDSSRTLVIFEVDVNGAGKPNQWGKDRFRWNFEQGSGRLASYSYINASYQGDGSREDWLERCTLNATTCAGLIQRDGWEIKDDYPWE